jgi:hypothetical protein
MENKNIIKNNFNDIFNKFKSKNYDFLFKPSKIININFFDNTTSIISQKAGFLSLTSSSNNEISNNEVNKLINMLQSDSNNSSESIATEELRNKLTNILQDGGGKKKKKSYQSNNINKINKHCVYYNKTDNLPHYEVNLKKNENKRYIYDPSFKGNANTHLGQRKLMLSEMQLLNEYYKLFPTNSVITIISVGSAAGHHLIQLNKMYPETKWILIDPAPFDKRLFDRPEIYRIINKLFTDDICNQLKKELKYKKFLFVSDIRRDEKDFETELLEICNYNIIG